MEFVKESFISKGLQSIYLVEGFFTLH